MQTVDNTESNVVWRVLTVRGREVRHLYVISLMLGNLRYNVEYTINGKHYSINLLPTYAHALARLTPILRRYESRRRKSIRKLTRKALKQAFRKRFKPRRK